MEGDGYPPIEIRALVNAEKANDAPSRVEKMTVDVAFPKDCGLQESYRKKLITIAERTCTIGNTLSRGVAITTTEKENVLK